MKEERIYLTSVTPDDIKQLKPNGYSKYTNKDVVIVLSPSGYGDLQSDFYNPRTGLSFQAALEGDFMYFDGAPTYQLTWCANLSVTRN
jgi:hypothetical protein